MSAAPFDAVEARTEVLARLDVITGLAVYDSEVPETPELDADGRVTPYAVLYPTAGRHDRSNLAATSNAVQWPFQVTVAGGDAQRCLWAAAAVAGALIDVRLDIAGWTCGPITQDPGPGILRDDQPRPPRHYTPLQFRLTAAPA